MVFLFGAADDPDCEPLAMLKANRSMQGSSDYRALQVELKDNARLKAVIDGRHKSVADYVTSQDEVVVVGRNVSGTHPLITADFEAGVSPADQADRLAELLRTTHGLCVEYEPGGVATGHNHLRPRHTAGASRCWPFLPLGKLGCWKVCQAPRPSC